MNRMIRDWMAGGYDIHRYMHDGNHLHGHRSPRRALLADFQDPSFDWSGFTDIIMVELEHQGGVSWIDDPPAISKVSETRNGFWYQVKPLAFRSVFSEFIKFCDWNLFPSWMPTWAFDLNRGMHLQVA